MEIPIPTSEEEAISAAPGRDIGSILNSNKETARVVADPRLVEFPRETRAVHKGVE